MNSISRSAREILLVLLLVGTTAERLEANPVGDFFKRVGRTISKPAASPAKTHTTRKTKESRNRPSAQNASPAPSSSPAAEPLATQFAAPAPPPSPTQPPPTPATTATVNERRAVSEPRSPADKNRDLPYGVPVPGRPGFVTSPFAPTKGYVDVRGFPAGTEVKDPYTGKVFLTP